MFYLFLWLSLLVQSKCHVFFHEGIGRALICVRSYSMKVLAKRCYLQSYLQRSLAPQPALRAYLSASVLAAPGHGF